MSKKMLQWIGLGSIIGACLFVGAGLIGLKEKIELTVATASDGTEIDPVGLLADDVATLRQDFQRFGSALGDGLQQLATGIEDARTEDIAFLEARLSTLREEVARLTEREAELSGRVAGLTAAVARAPAALAGTATSTPLEPTPIEIAHLEEPATSVAQPLPEATTAPAEPAAAPVKKKRGFLSFDLPTGKFAFDDAQRFQVIGSLSRVGFDAKSTLHDFTGVTSQVSGDFSLALGKPELGCSGHVEVVADTLRTGVDGRDENMREHLHTEEHPNLVFTLREVVADAIDAQAMTMTGTVVGTLTIAGHDEEVRVPVTFSVDDSRRVAISGEHSMKMSTYGVTPPSQLGMIEVEDDVRIWLELRARAVGTADLHAKASS